MPTEADARIVVDRLLREADWDIEDKAVVSTEEAAADGRADCWPLNQLGRARKAQCVVVFNSSTTKRLGFSLDAAHPAEAIGICTSIDLHKFRADPVQQIG